MSTFTLSLEDKPGQSHVHGFHLGTIERVARQIAEEKMQTCRENGWPMVTLALIRDGKIFDVLYRDGNWHNSLGLDEITEVQDVYGDITEHPVDKRAADRIDGYDRDDLGESPDY